MDNAAATTDYHHWILEWWDTDQRMSSGDCAEYLNIRVDTFYHYISTGRLRLKAYRIGRCNFYKRSEFLEAISKMIT